MVCDCFLRVWSDISFVGTSRQAQALHLGLTLLKKNDEPTDLRLLEAVFIGNLGLVQDPCLR